MKLWSFKTFGYHFARSIPLIRLILDSEIRNLRFLLELAPELPQKILDVGSGSGSTLPIYGDKRVVVGVDTSIWMLKKARKRKCDLLSVVGDAVWLPFRDGTLEWISAVGLSEYICQKERLLEEAWRVMVHGGYFLVTIAQPGFFNLLRLLLGHRLYTIGSEDWEMKIKKMGWVCVGKKRSLMQIQYLLKKDKP